MRILFIFYTTCLFTNILLAQTNENCLSNKTNCYEKLVKEGKCYLENEQFENAYNRFYAAQFCKELDKDSKRLLKLNALDSLIQDTYEKSDEILTKAKNVAESSRDSIDRLNKEANNLNLRLQLSNDSLEIEKRNVIKERNAAERNRVFKESINGALTSQNALRRKDADCALSLAYEGFITVDSFNTKKIDSLPIKVPAIVYEAFGNAVFEKNHKSIPTENNAFKIFEISPSKEKILTVAPNSTISVWKIQNSDEQPLLLLDTILSDNSSILSARFSADAQSILICRKDDTPYLWNKEISDKKLFINHSGADNGVFLNNNRILTTARDGSINLWKKQDENLVLDMDESINLGLPILDFLISTKQSKGIFRTANKIFIIDFNNLKDDPIEIIHGGMYIYEMALSPDEQHLASVSHNGELILFSLEENKIINKIMHDNRPVYSVSFNPKNSTVFTGSTNGKAIFTSYHQSTTAIIERNYPITSVDFSPQGNYAASISDNIIFLYKDSQEDKIIRTAKTISFITFSDNDKQLISCSNASQGSILELWDIINGTKLMEISFDSFLINTQFIEDGKKILAITAHGKVVFFPNPSYTLEQLNKGEKLLDVNAKDCEENE